MREERSVDGGAVLARGAVIELSEQTARRLIAEGVAEEQKREIEKDAKGTESKG